MKILYFTAPWCQPCKMLGPQMEVVAEEGIPVQKVNIDTDTELSTKYGVRNIPTLLKVDDSGAVIAVSVGYRHANEIKQWYNG